MQCNPALLSIENCFFITSYQLRDWRKFDGALIKQREAVTIQFRIIFVSNLEIASSCRTRSGMVQTGGMTGLHSLPKMETLGWITWRPSYQPTGALPSPRSVSV